jgi:hypothetical protein
MMKGVFPKEGVWRKAGGNGRNVIKRFSLPEALMTNARG